MTALWYHPRRHGGRHRIGLQTTTLTRPSPSAETRRFPCSHRSMRATRGSGSRSEQALCTILTPIAPEHHRLHSHIHRHAIMYLIQSCHYTLQQTHVAYRLCRSGVTNGDMNRDDNCARLPACPQANTLMEAGMGVLFYPWVWKWA